MVAPGRCRGTTFISDQMRQTGCDLVTHFWFHICTQVVMAYLRIVTGQEMSSRYKVKRRGRKKMSAS